MQRIEDQNLKLAQENGVLRARLTLAAAENADTLRGLRRKVARQARVIVRLEGGLRENGQRPYEGASLAETSTGAEYDEHDPQP